MKLIGSFTALCVLMFLSITAVAADNSGRIYGKITTVDNDVLEGLIRWDKNEGSWLDVLNGSKDLSRDDDLRKSRSKRKKYGSRGSSYKIFGITISDESDLRNSGWSSWSSSAQSGLRFGHILSMEVVDDDRVRLELKSGQEIELYGGSTDIGTGIREIVIEDRSEGELELTWDDIDRIDFASAETDEQSSFGDRLFGTLTTRRGDEFTGYICWDVDEIFSQDILDGEERNRDRKVRFGKIAAIERYSSKGATVELKSGDDIVLRGTNDVNSGNRGIIVSDKGFGQVRVDWDEFERLQFSDPAYVLSYDKFDGGRLLQGTVYTEDGDKYTGTICWDNDEEHSWELLDGEYRGMEFDIELGLIKKIEKKSFRASIITVWDGREFTLRGSNDVDEDNKGIFVTLDDGDEVIIDWDEFERVEFAKP